MALSMGAIAIPGVGRIATSAAAGEPAPMHPFSKEQRSGQTVRMGITKEIQPKHHVSNVLAVCTVVANYEKHSGRNVMSVLMVNIATTTTTTPLIHA